jgi:hypothetical protein
MTSTISLPLLAALAALGSAPAPSPPPAPGQPLPLAQQRDWNEPPPGSLPEDAALWHRVRDTNNDAVLTMARVTSCSFRLRYGRYYESLDEYVKANEKDAAAVEKGKAMRARLETAAREADEAIPKQGLRVRTCRYTLLHFEQRMDAKDDPKLAAELPRYREEARACADEIGAFATRLHPRADALEAALAAVDEFLGRATPAPPQGAAAGAQAKEAP